MDLLLFAGSLRKDSFNKKLLKIAEGELKAMGHQVTVADIKALNIPIYDGDVEVAGMPAGVTQLAEMVKKTQVLVIASPEYNGSISSPLKNTIDWLSRLKPVPLEGKPVLLMGASIGMFGANRGMLHGRDCFEKLMAFVYPEGFGVMKAVDAFTTDGAFHDPKQLERLQGTLKKFSEFARKLSS
jgi:NAD(P)H-dependent FMN reductase